MNKPEEYNDEIESFELNEDDYINNYNQNGQNSTLLMDRFGNESSEMVFESLFESLFQNLIKSLIERTNF